MGYLRRLFIVVTVAVQLVTLAYVMVVMGQSQAYDVNRSIVNSTDARAIYYLAATAFALTAGLALMLWLERRGPSRKARRAALEHPDDPTRQAER